MSCKSPVTACARLIPALALVFALATQAWALPYDQEVLSDAPLGYWRFEAGEPAGVATDSSGFGRHGAYMGGVTPGFFPGAAMIGGNSAAFDGSTGFVQLLGTWGGTPEITIEAWVNPSAITGGFQTFVGTPSGGVAHVQLAPFGNTVTYVDNCCVTLLPPPPEGPTDTWRHVVVTGKSGDTRIFVDGVQTGADPLAFSFITPSTDVHIGNGHVNTRFFNGLLDEVAIYATALSPQRVMEHYAAAGNPPPPPPPPPPAAVLLAHWTFDQDAQDVSGGGHHGVLNG
ncbi:MAG: LamG domain-containing protein, partial [Pirellulales bacterium]